MYSKRGKWERMTVDFVLYHFSGFWFIGFSSSVTSFGNGCFRMILCKAPWNDDSCKIPQENGWIVVGKGMDPAPHCRPNHAIDNSEGGGFLTV